MTQQTLGFTLEELARLTGARLVGDPSYCVSHVADLEHAGPQDASFLANPRYAGVMRRSQAGVIFVEPSIAPIDERNLLLTPEPSKAFQKVAELFYPSDSHQSGFQDVHPTACIHQEAKIGFGVTIGPYAVIDRGVTIAPHCQVGAHCSIGANSSLGRYTLLHPHVTIRENCHLGSNVVIQPGAVIGSCGFGYLTDAKGKHIKLRQMGSVVIEDDVEIGANTCIDRARFKETRIKRGTKIDNLVQIAHGVVLGEDNLIVSQVGIAGSSKTGHHVVMGGQAALVGHIEIADNVIIAARGAPAKSLKTPGEKYAGAPAVPLMEHNRNSVHLRQIEKYVKRIEELEKKVDMKS